MKVKTILYVFIIAAACFTSGCSSEFDEPEILNEAEVAYADIALSFGSDWTIDFGSESRGAPPGTGGNNDADTKVDGEADMSDVDCVRVIAFKRRDTGTNGDFIYDITNDMVLPVESTPINGTDGKPTGHKHRVAKGKLKKVYGYQYRVIAIAYSSYKESLYKDAALHNESTSRFKKIHGEQNWFTINTASTPTFQNICGMLDNIQEMRENEDNDGWRDFTKGKPYYGYAETTYHNWYIDKLSLRAVQVPQLFFGTLRTETKKDVIEYAETMTDGELSATIPITGILYRGVAKLKINLKPYFHKKNGITDSDRYVCWVALLADNVQTDVNLRSYDDFLTPSSNGIISDKYTVISYQNFTESECKEPEMKPIISYFLQTDTRLILRVKTSDDEVHNYQIKTSSDIVSGGNGTGIISPDVIDGVFYLRRNHLYNMTIDLEKLSKSKHEIK